MDNFPLLRLPLIVLDLVLSIADDTTRVEILLLDKQVGGTNTEHLLTTIGKNELIIYFGWPKMTSLAVKHISDLHHMEGPEETMMIRDVSVPIKFFGLNGLTYYVAFFESQFDGFILLLDYFRGTFGSRISEHTINCVCEGLVPVIQSVDEYIRRSQGSFNGLFLVCDLNQGQESFQYVLKNVTACDCIRINQIRQVPDGYHLTEPITIRRLFVDLMGSWFTLENLLAARSEEINLRKTTLGNLEMQKYLVEWEKGNVPSIKLLECELKEAGDLQLILSGFNDKADVKKNIRYNEKSAFIPSSAIGSAVIIKIIEERIIMEFDSDVARAEFLYNRH